MVNFAGQFWIIKALQNNEGRIKKAGIRQWPILIYSTHKLYNTNISFWQYTVNTRSVRIVLQNFPENDLFWCENDIFICKILYICSQNRKIWVQKWNFDRKGNFWWEKMTNFSESGTIFASKLPKTAFLQKRRNLLVTEFKFKSLVTNDTIIHHY